MNHRLVRPLSMLSALILLLHAGCASTTPGHDEAFWRTAKCQQLNGLRFQAQFYENNQKADSDVLWFRNDTLQSERWMTEGFHTAMCACQDHGVGTIRIKANMIDAENRSRIWNFTIKGGKLDGVMSAVATQGDYVMYSFAGEELP